MRISTTRAIALPLTLVLLLVASSLTLSAVPQPALTNYNALFQYNGTTLFNIGVNYGFPLSPIPVSDPDGDSWGFGFSVTRDQLEMQVAPGGGPNSTLEPFVFYASNLGPGKVTGVQVPQGFPFTVLFSSDSVTVLSTTTVHVTQILNATITITRG
jgi:hypothetical protein